MVISHLHDPQVRYSPCSRPPWPWTVWAAPRSKYKTTNCLQTYTYLITSLSAGVAPGHHPLRARRHRRGVHLPLHAAAALPQHLRSHRLRPLHRLDIRHRQRAGQPRHIYTPTYIYTSMYIYTLFPKVSLLRAFGVMFGLSNAILGLTVLAWGNSIGDMIADTAMARLDT